MTSKTPFNHLDVEGIVLEEKEKKRRGILCLLLPPSESATYIIHPLRPHEVVCEVQPLILWAFVPRPVTNYTCEADVYHKTHVLRLRPGLFLGLPPWRLSGQEAGVLLPRCSTLIRSLPIAFLLTGASALVTCKKPRLQPVLCYDRTTLTGDEFG